MRNREWERENEKRRSARPKCGEEIEKGGRRKSARDPPDCKGERSPLTLAKLGGTKKGAKEIKKATYGEGERGRDIRVCFLVRGLASSLSSFIVRWAYFALFFYFGLLENRNQEPRSKNPLLSSHSLSLIYFFRISYLTLRTRRRGRRSNGRAETLELLRRKFSWKRV